MNSCTERLYNGLIKENPTFVMMLGMCPTLAVTTSAINGIGMGLSTTVVLVLSNMLISMLRKVIPDSVRMPAFIVIVASFVTMVQFLLQGFVPSLYDSLGIYIPLIVVNCIILGRAEMFARKNTVFDSALDGLGMGIGFTIALLLMATFREVLGNGTFAGIAIPVLSKYNVPILTASPGGFFAFGCIIALVSAITNKPKDKIGCEGCAAAETCSGICPSNEKKEDQVNA